MGKKIVVKKIKKADGTFDEIVDKVDFDQIQKYQFIKITGGVIEIDYQLEEKNNLVIIDLVNNPATTTFKINLKNIERLIGKTFELIIRNYMGSNVYLTFTGQQANYSNSNLISANKVSHFKINYHILENLKILFVNRIGELSM